MYYRQIFSLLLTLLQIFTGLLPFAELAKTNRNYAQVCTIISTQVPCGRRPQKPAINSPAYLSYGLTDSIWEMMEICWDPEPRRRPSADDVSKLPFLVDVPDDRLVNSEMNGMVENVDHRLCGQQCLPQPHHHAQAGLFFLILWIVPSYIYLLRLYPFSLTSSSLT